MKWTIILIIKCKVQLRWNNVWHVLLKWQSDESWLANVSEFESANISRGVYKNWTHWSLWVRSCCVMRLAQKLTVDWLKIRHSEGGTVLWDGAWPACGYQSRSGGDGGGIVLTRCCHNHDMKVLSKTVVAVLQSVCWFWRWSMSISGTSLIAKPAPYQMAITEQAQC